MFATRATVTKTVTWVTSSRPTLPNTAGTLRRASRGQSQMVAAKNTTAIAMARTRNVLLVRPMGVSFLVWKFPYGG